MPHSCWRNVSLLIRSIHFVWLNRIRLHSTHGCDEEEDHSDHDHEDEASATPAASAAEACHTHRGMVSFSSDMELLLILLIDGVVHCD